MHSDLKNLLRLTSLQTKILFSVIALFSVIVVFFLVLYSKTEIHSRLSHAQNSLSERVINLDNSVENYINHIARMKSMAGLYLTSSEHATLSNKPNPVATQKAWQGMQIDPSMDEKAMDDPSFQREFAMAANLYAVQNAMIHVGSHVVRSYYYSNQHGFYTSLPPPIHPGEGMDQTSIKTVLKSRLRLESQTPPVEPFWTGPYIDDSLNRSVMTAAVHLYQENRLVGALGIDIDMGAFAGYTTPLIEGLGHVYLADQNGSLLAGPMGTPLFTKAHKSLNIHETLPEQLEPFIRKNLTTGTHGCVLKHGYLVYAEVCERSSFTLFYLISLKDFVLFMIPQMKVYLLFLLTVVAFFGILTYIIITRFIRSTRLAEIALHRAHGELEVRVCERTTELSRINDELKESREKYRHLFTYAPAGIYEIDYVLNKFVSVNDVMCEYSGYSRQEFLALNPFDLLTEQGKAVFKDRLNRVLKGESISRNVELDIHTKSGTPMNVVLNNSYIFEGDKIRGARVVLHDISERKVAEKALKKSEERFRNLVESTTDWIWDIDYKGDFVYSSPSVETITGYSPDKLKGQRFINFFPIFEREKLYMALMKNIRPGEVLSTIECSIQTLDGEIRTLETRGVHYFDDMGNFQGVRGISRDITEKKKSEDERAELQRTLERAKKMEALGLLAGGVAHDLNNILSGVINYPELILMDLPVDSAIRDHVKAIYMSGKKAAAIVDDLITVARGAARKREIVNLNCVISEYMESAEYHSMTAQNPEVLMRFNLGESIHNITSSSVQVRKALLNLVVNAVEALDGRGEVSISSANIELTEPLKGYSDIPKGDYVLLRVTDTGGGISSDDMERIFEPFYSKKVMGRSGTGLGLAIVWNTVSDHGGYINVTSGKNGTAFDLYFPSTPFCHTECEDTCPMDHVKGEGQKILVVDDETIQREIATQLLQSLRYSSIALESGEKAVEYLKSKEADVVLLDMIMEPGMNGRETYEKIIAIKPTQKVVITTGYADTNDVKLAQEKGAGELLRKPYTLKELGSVINRQFEN